MPDSQRLTIRADQPQRRPSVIRHVLGSVGLVTASAVIPYVHLASGPTAHLTPTVAAPREVEVEGFDYAFKLPKELPAGRTTFRFINRGKVAHEFNVELLEQGVTLEDYMAAANAKKPLDPFVEATVGVLFAEPGGRSPSGLSTDLLAGRTYAIRCIFKDSKDAPRHEALGMFSALHVTAAKGAASTPLRVDTIVGMDYAFRAPATLTPGLHYLAFVNTGKHRHELNLTLLRKGRTLQQLVEIERSGGDVDSVLEPGGFGVLDSPAGEAPLGLLQLEMLPGREYLLVCLYTDSANAPPHYKLGMFGSIRVSEKAAKP